MKSIEKYLSVFKDRKKLLWVLILSSIGIMLLSFSAFGGAGGGEESAEMTLEEYKKEMESELEKLCASIDGVGKCRVTVTFLRGRENTYKGSNLIESKPPKVLGVSIVCRGADSDTVRAELTELFCALFDIRSNRISVLKLN